MFAEERHAKIVDLLNERKSVKVSELSRMLKISEVTVRRDLEELQSQGKALRTHGGAMAMYSVASEISALELISSNKCIEEKRKISALAYQHLKDKDTIFADSSSTVHELVKLIVTGSKKNLLVITTSLLTVSMLADRSDVKVIMIGGEINYRHNSAEGHITKEIIRSLRADKAFIGINGIDEHFGYSTPRFEDAEVKAELMNSSMQSYILADYTKFGKSYLAKVKGECDYIITDRRQSGCDYDWICQRTNLLFADQ